MHIETKKIQYDKDKDKDVKLVNLKNMEYKDYLLFKNDLTYNYYNYYVTTKNDTNGNIRIFNLANRKKYVCIDADDKKSNDHVSYVMKKYDIKDNCYPSISNYFYHDYGENAYKHHYWFETDMPITSHVHVNHALLDIWGPKGEYTSDPWLKNKYKKCNIDKDNDSLRVIFEPNVEGMYLDASKKYPVLTKKIYHDIMNVNLNTSIFSSNKKTPSCIYHDDCIGFELMKHRQNSELTKIQNKNSSIVVAQPRFNKFNIFKPFQNIGMLKPQSKAQQIQNCDTASNKKGLFDFLKKK